MQGIFSTLRGKKFATMTYIYRVEYQKVKLSGEVRSFRPIGCAVLSDMKLNEIKKKLSSVIATLED